MPLIQIPSIYLLVYPIPLKCNIMIFVLVCKIICPQLQIIALVNIIRTFQKRWIVYDASCCIRNINCFNYIHHWMKYAPNNSFHPTCLCLSSINTNCATSSISSYPFHQTFHNGRIFETRIVFYLIYSMASIQFPQHPTKKELWRRDLSRLTK